MNEAFVLKTEKREERGSHQTSKLRKKGMVPAVLYGHKEETLSVSVTHEDVAHMLRLGAPVVDLNTDKGVEKAQIMELQWDHLGKEVLHVDFKRVSADERIQTDVLIEVRGTAPGIAEGGVLDQPMHSLRIECPAISVPKTIRVNIGELQIEGSIKVKDVHLPENCKSLDDPDSIVIHVTRPEAEAEAPAEAAAAAGAVEPEVITARKKEEEGEGE
jgi:large subunit ribosomal protein L25